MSNSNFRFGQPISDREKLARASYNNSVCDSVPNPTEHKTWQKIRARKRSLEIGPEFRHHFALQTERIMHSLSK